MKQLLSTYSIAAGGVVTLTGVNRPQEAILLISDATTGNVLYSAATGGASAYTQGTNSTITLTTAPGLSDKLQIFYDDGVAPANAPSSVTVSGTVTANIGTAGTLALEAGNLATVKDNTGSIKTNTTDVPNVVGTPGSAVPSKGVVVQGTDGTNARTLSTDTSGQVNVNVKNSSIAVTGTFYQATQPVSLTALPALSTGSNVIGAVTQSGTWSVGISGTPSVSISGVALDATLTGGTTKAIARGGAKGTTTAADVTSTSVDANTQALHVAVTGTPSVSVSAALPTGTNSIGQVTANPATGTLTSYAGTLSSNAAATVNLVSGSIQNMSKFFVFTNNSSQVMYLAFGADATTSNGLYIGAYGGYECPFIPTGKISVICPTASSSNTASYAAYGA